MLKFLMRKSTGVFLVALALAGVSLFVAGELPVFLYPQTARAQIQVTYSHPGLSALDFQSQYAESLEGVYLGLEDLEKIETTYSTDRSELSLVFDWGVDTDSARARVDAAASRAELMLPDYLRDMASVRSRQGENAGYIVLGVSSASTTSAELFKLLEGNAAPLLSRIEGAEELALIHSEELRAQVVLQPNLLLSFGLTVNDVNTALQAGVAPQPLGSLSDGETRYSVRMSAASSKLSELGNLEIARKGLFSIRLSDVSDITVERTLPSRVFLVEGRPAIQVTATPVDGGDLTALTDDIEAVLKQAVADGKLPADTLFTYYLDPAKYIRRSIGNVIQSAIIGGLLAVLIVFLMLGEVRNTFIVASSIPLSIIYSLFLMWATGMSFNLISLGGLALAVGMIVDSTIVVMENIHRHRLEYQGEMSFKLWRQLIIDAVKEVQGPIIGSTLTSVAVFLPIVFTAPLTNAILGDQARTVVYALTLSLVISLTIVPLVAYYLYRGHDRVVAPHRGVLKWVQSGLERLKEAYGSILFWLASGKKNAAAFLAASAGLVALSLVFILPSIPKEVLPTPTSDRLLVFFRNTAISDTETILNEYFPGMEEKVRAVLGPRLKSLFANISGRFNQILVDLHSSQDTESAVMDLQAVFESSGDWYFNVLAWDPASLPLPFSADIQFQVSGPEASTKVRILDEIRQLLSEENLYRRVFTRPSATVTQELLLQPKEETIDRLSPWNVSSLTALIRRVLGGTASITLTEGTEQVDVSARFPDGYPAGREDLENILIPWKNSFVPLGHFFTFQTREGISQIYSEDGVAVFRIIGRASFEVSDAERSRLALQARNIIETEYELPPGYAILWEDPQEEINEAMSSLFLALGLSAVLVFLILAFQFNSLWVPMMVMLTIPYGLVGVVLSLFLFGSTLNLNSMLGTILLGGLVVNNAILLIDFILLRRSSMPLRDALVEAGKLRITPILITSLTTLLGMLPLALGLGEGSNILQPLGIAVSGGLLFSTVLTVFGIPALLFLTEKLLPARHE